MTEPTGETGPALDADTATDAELNAALGLGGQSADDTDTDTTGPEPEDITTLPEWAQKEVNRLRRENAAARVKAREAKRAVEKPTDKPEGEKVDVEKIRAEARAEARLENGTRLAAAEIRGQLASILPDDHLDDLIDDLNLAKYVDDDGEVDTNAVKALRDKYKTLLDRRRGPRPVTSPQGPSTKKTPAEELSEALGL